MLCYMSQLPAAHSKEGGAKAVMVVQQDGKLTVLYCWLTVKHHKQCIAAHLQAMLDQESPVMVP